MSFLLFFVLLAHFELPSTTSKQFDEWNCRKEAIEKSGGVDFTFDRRFLLRRLDSRRGCVNYMNDVQEDIAYEL